jgi:hypothetical protein
MSSIPSESSSTIPANPTTVGPSTPTEGSKEPKGKNKATAPADDKVETAAQPTIPTQLPHKTAAGVGADAKAQAEPTPRANGGAPAPRAAWSLALEDKINSWLQKGKQAYAQAKEFGTRVMTYLMAGLHEAGIFMMSVGKTLANLAKDKAHEPAEGPAAAPAPKAATAPDNTAPQGFAKKNN